MPKFSVGKKAKQKKYPIGVDEQFIQDVESASTDHLKSLIVQYQQGIGASQAFLKCDDKQLSEEEYAGAQKLKDLKNEYDMAAAPTREAIRALRNKTKVVLEEMKKDGR